MARLKIQHRTVYQYERPVSFGRHRLVLRPREGHDLRVLSMRLQIEPAHELAWTRDVFGNSVAIVDFTSEAARLEIISDVVVERWAPFPRHPAREAWFVPYPVLYDAMEAGISSAYQIASFPEDAAVLRDWNDCALPTAERRHAHEMMNSLCNTIKQEIRYLRRSEKGVQNPAQTLTLGQGSCRDMATLMLEAARALGIASRFASGYLHCAASDAGRASTHAWMEAYLPGPGWCGFDPTLGEPASQKHIPIGVCQHPRGVMPISGLYSGTRADFREMTVQVSTETLDEE